MDLSSGSWKYTVHDPVGIGWTAAAPEGGMAAAAAKERLIGVVIALLVIALLGPSWAAS
jgi:hypothetical protein